MSKRRIPDTLLLEERAIHALNATVGMADEDHGGIPFFNADLNHKPAFMTHGDWDYGSSHGRMIDAMTLARIMSGSTYGVETEKRYKENLLSFFKEDGLSYRGVNPVMSWESNANLIDQRAVLLALTSWYMTTGDARAKEAADRHVAALKRIAVKERDVWYYPASEYKDSGWPSLNAVQLRLAPDPAAFCGRLVMPLLKYYELTGNADAYELCQFFTNLIIHRSGVFNEDGSFNSSLAYRSGHFHTRLGTLDAIARFGYHTRDASILNFVKKSYDWALTWCTSFGWTPGDMQEQAYEHETCSLVDLITTGITLARSGYTNYWGVVERFIRNHLAESQLLDLSWVEETDDKSKDVQGWLSYYKVAQRTRGSFAGYSAPNDFICDHSHGRGHTSDLQICCLGSGTRGLFMGWSNTITEELGTVSVNFLLSRGSRKLDVSSYLPYEGKVVLDVREDIPKLQVRIPEWAGFTKVRIVRELDGETTEGTGSEPSRWAGQCFLQLGAARAGETITVTFPLSVRTTTETALGEQFVTHWRGDDVVDISPRGKRKPLYSGRPIADQAPLRKGDYHRPEREFVW
ncbi:hypothetical protein B1A99_25710 [Cohnella sp. CIP 111063]|uniref:hypothetical protein n=1 Tax=unclassified Cohnella TaxID=2636738 RepID=UPI000B8BB524|nr:MULTISPECIES: hypothetical protein [unclassified Cohnella]OXS54726.1 hypothetical protein B1A99_25710 [Cohnella sp. CIP 111063]PRX64562.1 DUF1680 family protein [Cohnella sp. SGD-V74]